MQTFTNTNPLNSNDVSSVYARALFQYDKVTWNKGTEVDIYYIFYTYY